MNDKQLDKILDDYKSSKYIDVKSILDYKALPVEKRSGRVWYWPAPWYKLPRSLPVENFQDLVGPRGSWGELDRFLADEFPIQYFLRDGYRNNKLYWFFRRIGWKTRDVKYWIKYFLFPCRPELLKAIPKNQYFDLPEVMREFLFACVISLVEGEYEGKIPHHSLKNVHKMEKPMLIKWNEFYDELKKCYKYITIERKELVKNLDLELTACSKLKSDKKYLKYWKMEKQLDQLDKKWLKWVVAENASFWA
jgi:hypothetical protein